MNKTLTLTHAGRSAATGPRMVNLPIEQGSTVLFDTLAEFEAGREARYTPGTAYYGRYGTEASAALEQMLCDLEGGAGCVSLASGLASVTLPLLALTKAGDHILVADTVYGPTRSFCDGVLARFGVAVEYFDPMDLERLAGQLRKKTAVVMLETPGSHTFEVPDVPAIAGAAAKFAARVILDSTWATPLHFNGLAHGVDVVCHSGSKYISGHADAMIGFAICNAATFDAVRAMAISLGDKAGSQDIFLALRGLRTLEMRMAQVARDTLAIATWFQGQSGVRRVLYPALPECPGHGHWARDFSGAAGLFSVVFDPLETNALHRFVDGLKLFGVGVSWGGYESLVLPVVPHRTATPWVEDGQVIRFSIGFEGVEALIDDLTRAWVWPRESVSPVA